MDTVLPHNNSGYTIQDSTTPRPAYYFNNGQNMDAERLNSAFEAIISDLNSEKILLKTAIEAISTKVDIVKTITIQTINFVEHEIIFKTIDYPDGYNKNNCILIGCKANNGTEIAQISIDHVKYINSGIQVALLPQKTIENCAVELVFLKIS